MRTVHMEFNIDKKKENAMGILSKLLANLNTFRNGSQKDLR